jgi:hypothetical protein
MDERTQNGGLHLAVIPRYDESARVIEFAKE